MTTTLDAPPVSPLPVPETTRWQPLRAGLQDIWQYDHTTRFVFHRGRMLLRGRNGAGKTKVVEVLLPFLLEGRLQPSRLDPFGTRSRKMHYNVLPPDRDAASAIGYAWLEFGRRDDDGRECYTTIGAGLIGGYSMITEALHRRRVEADESDRFVARLFGLEITQHTYDTGTAFVDGVVERAGFEALEPLWQDARFLPPPAEIAAPGLWLARIELPDS
jgi:hypothetical protein